MEVLRCQFGEISRRPETAHDDIYCLITTTNTQLPEGVRIYAISDIHGCAHLLEPMLRVIDVDVARSRPRHAIEAFVGDHIDRGPDTRATLDILIERSRRGNAVFLKGNDEAFLVKVFEDCSRIGSASAGPRP